MEPRLLQAVHVPAPPWTLQAPGPIRRSEPPRHASPSAVRPSPVRPSWAPSSARLRAELTEPTEPAESVEPRPATPSSLWPEGGGRIRLPCKVRAFVKLLSQDPPFRFELRCTGALCLRGLGGKVLTRATQNGSPRGQAVGSEASQRLQYPLIREYTLHHIRDPNYNLRHIP